MKIGDFVWGAVQKHNVITSFIKVITNLINIAQKLLKLSMLVKKSVIIFYK